MGFLDRLKKAKDIVSESPQHSNEELSDMAMSGQDPRQVMAGEGMTKALRAGIEMSPDPEETSLPMAPAQKYNLFGKEINIPEQRFDMTGVMGGIKNIAREVGPAAEALKAIQLSNKEEKLAKLKNFLSGSNVLQGENSAQVLGKIPEKQLGRTLVSTGEDAVSNLGKTIVEPTLEQKLLEEAKQKPLNERFGKIKLRP